MQGAYGGAYPGPQPGEAPPPYNPYPHSYEMNQSGASNRQYQDARSQASSSGPARGSRNPAPKERQPQRQRQQPKGREFINPCLKYSIFFFNFFFWLLGAGVAGLGMWLLIDKDKEVRDVLDIIFDPSVLLCVAGCVIFVVAFFGCLGALRENICLLRSFWIFLMLILLIEILLGVLVFLYYYVPSVRQQLDFLSLEKLPLDAAIERYRDDDDQRDLIDNIQKAFECCGVKNDNEGYKDWQKNMYFNCSDSNPSVERCGVPASCCVVTEGELVNVMCGFDTTNKPPAEVEDKIYTQGCLKGFGSWIDRNIIIIGASCLAVIVPELVGVCLARMLIGQIEDQKAQWRR